LYKTQQITSYLWTWRHYIFNEVNAVHLASDLALVLRMHFCFCFVFVLFCFCNFFLRSHHTWLQGGFFIYYITYLYNNLAKTFTSVCVVSISSQSIRSRLFHEIFSEIFFLKFFLVNIFLVNIFLVIFLGDFFYEIAEHWASSYNTYTLSTVHCSSQQGFSNWELQLVVTTNVKHVTFEK
jgi:hypothetical protein